MTMIYQRYHIHQDYQRFHSFPRFAWESWTERTRIVLSYVSTQSVGTRQISTGIVFKNGIKEILFLHTILVDNEHLQGLCLRTGLKKSFSYIQSL